MFNIRANNPRSGDIASLSDSSISVDRGRKAHKYAEAGIVDYWIVCLKDRTVEVHRQPDNGEYALKTVHRIGDSIAPVASPESLISVSDLLPLE